MSLCKENEGEKMCIIDEIALGKIVDLVCKKIGEAISSAKWKELFVSTGEFIIKSPDKLDSFTKDLSVAFSKNNLIELSKKMKNRSGFEFSETLRNELYDLMAKYEIPPYDAEEYIRMFAQSIIGYIEEHNKEKTLEMFIGDFRKETESRFDEVIKKEDLIISKLEALSNPKVTLLTVADIDSRIRKHSRYKGLSLDFFEIDENEFQQKFKNSIDNKMIFVVGKSHEETIYRILNELKSKYSEKTVFVIESRAEWDKLENNNLSGCVLIPKFYDENIPAISNNTNIFVYNEDEPCYSNEKLVLRKRTRKNLVSALEKLGIESNDAYTLADNTHGLYSALRKKLFNEASYTKNPWVESHTDVVIAALLCGKWTESEGDKLIFEELTGISYAECKKELLEYSYGEMPFVVEFKGHRCENMQIASIEDAWEELDYYITDAKWDKFIKLLYEVLIVSEPIFDHPFEKHFEVSTRVPKPDWSQALKRGMLRTLVMRAFYRKHDENQYAVDNIIKKILETINTTKRWGYISQYLPELCEASPKAVIERLEKELESPSGLKELFEINDGDFMTSRHYYTNVLFAVEQLLQQKQYVVRAIEWLWNMDSYNIKYSLSNSPKEILGTVFCAWINMSVLTVEQKIELAKKAIEKYSNAWEIIYSNFPNERTTVFSTFSTPRHRSVDEPEDIYRDQLNKTYIEYLNICVNNINGDVERWKKIIGALHMYPSEYQDDVFGRLVEVCKTMSDPDKTQIKNKLRNTLYRHRYFSDADWSVSEDVLKKYESVFNTISVENKVYDFLYLFTPSYDFPLLNPVPFHCEEESSSSREENEVQREREILSLFKTFKENGYSIDELIELAAINDKYSVGEVLAEFYCENIFDKNIYVKLFESDASLKQAYEYARTLHRTGNVSVNAILKTTKEITKNSNFIAYIISLEPISNDKTALIRDESEDVKKEYWSLNLRRTIANDVGESVCLWALDECKKYGTLDSYLQLLFDIKDQITDSNLYNYILYLTDFKTGVNHSMTDYYLKKLLEILQSKYMDDAERCTSLGFLEWQCREILEWEDMKCIQKVMKVDPSMYAMLAKAIFKSEETDEVTGEQRNIANKLYSGYNKAQFCPCEKDGKVDYDELKAWIDAFKELLIAQKQLRLFEHLIGRLLVFSPPGEDGFMPCEAVSRIIEDNYSDSLKREYAIAEKNKRGVYTFSAGESELQMSEDYRKNAQHLQEKYPHTAEIYFYLSDSYKWDAEQERKRAENEF